MNRKRKWRNRAAVLLLGSVLLLDSRFHLSHSEYHLASPGLPEAFSDFHIVHLSDLHGMRFGRENEKLCRAVRELRPDLIAITGDMAGNAAELPAFEELLRGLAGTAPVVYVGGNHEWSAGIMDRVNVLLARYGAENLENRWVRLEREGEHIVLAGAADANSRADRLLPEELTARLRREEPESFVLLLGHRNTLIQDCPELPVDLILSGHAHGGIVRLPFVGGLLSVGRKIPARYEKGLYRSGDYTMVVSTGLGNSIPVPRLFNRPEIVSVILHRGQA